MVIILAVVPVPVTGTLVPATTLVVGKLKEPPPLDKVIVFPDCDNVWGVCVGKVTLFQIGSAHVLTGVRVNCV